MARAIPGFNDAEFRTGIRLAMTVGLPPATDDQPLFVFPRTVTNDSPADDAGIPFDPAARPTETTVASKRVTCAVVYDDAAPRVENMGIVVPSVVKLTFLDQDYDQVKGFDSAIIAGDRYVYRFTETPVGLDSVAVWTVHCVAEDDA